MRKKSVKRTMKFEISPRVLCSCQVMNTKIVFQIVCRNFMVESKVISHGKNANICFFWGEKNPCSVCQSSFAQVVKIFKNNITCTVGDTFRCAAPEMIERNMHFETLVCSVDLVNKKISKICVTIPLHLLHISVSFFK